MFVCFIKCVIVWFVVMSVWALSGLIRKFVKHKREGGFS